MRFYRKPRKGQLNHEIERLLMKSFQEAGENVSATLPILQAKLAKLPKKWRVRETCVAYDSELVPARGDWKPGRMTPFVESIHVTAYRIRPNRSFAEHKVNFVYWPVTPSNLPPEESNPQIHSIVDDPYHNVSVLKKAG